MSPSVDDLISSAYMANPNLFLLRLNNIVRPCGGFISFGLVTRANHETAAGQVIAR